MLQEILRAFGLVLVIEGIIPFLYPARWRGLVAMLATISEKQLRTMGFVSMGIGILLLYSAWFFK